MYNCLSAETATDPFFRETRGGGGVATVGCVCVCYVCVIVSTYLFSCARFVGRRAELRAWACRWNTRVLEYDVEALIMDVGSSWKGGKALIYTHRFPGIFIGLAKCHYTAGG